MFSFIYFIWAFHLRKEILHKRHHPLNSISSHLPYLFTLGPLSFSRTGLEVLNNFFGALTMVKRSLGPGCFWAHYGWGLCTTQGSNNPVLQIAILLRTSSVFFFLYHFTPCPVQNSPYRALEEFILSPMMIDALPWSLNPYKD